MKKNIFHLIQSDVPSIKGWKIFFVGMILNLVFGFSAPTREMLHVSYDPTRELFVEYNAYFTQQWQSKTGEKLVIHQSHGGSGKQARSVVDGLRADVVSLALGFDIDLIAKRSGLIAADWQNQFPDRSSPYYSTIVFLVRRGNPKKIHGWEDLARPGVEVITPNPKTSGGARWNYLAAWGYALKKWGNDEKKALEFVTSIYRNVPVLDAGARGAAMTFTERLIGDVLVTWENEAFLAKKTSSSREFEIVTPEVSILAEPPVAVVSGNAQKSGNQEVATAYLQGLYSEHAQEMVARHYFRPRLATVMEKYSNLFAKTELFNLSEIFGTWQQAHEKHFASDALF